MTTELPNRVFLVELLAKLRARPASPERDRAIVKVERQLAALGE